MEYVIEKHTKSWVPTSRDNSFSNQLIDAYMNGKRDGVQQYKSLEISKLNENINKSGTITVNIINILKEKKISPIDAYLRVHSFERFDIMVTVPENDYLKDEFLDIYDIISDFEEKSKDDFYSAFISICSTNNHFDEQIVASDGYALKLAKK